ncbi:3D domain-containing protein [Denitromonas iodatirespirans]|uniref:3D domain-containing protein n=1 Tax=Denitromonas iodatirespirans TaxID=2795389 RepID=A0A944D725_DENI1|nr:3D domain-containing protein [Denitromonas iodatirespirans]MBT0961025.1 3D domain-containing protein [Denitromonas iodatirespirans]
MTARLRRYFLLLLPLLLTACGDERQSMTVTATAYTSSPGETDDTPDLAAWGDTLAPGMKVIAVSRDLLELGLVQGAEVTIEGLDGEYVVLDKMHPRWTQKIDIYMGDNVKKARAWGRREVTIRWDGERE